MIPLSDGEWRLAFSTWLRTGRLPEVRSAEDTECKFNPWHDPDDGRFTFRGTGVYYGGGSSGSSGGSKRPSKPTPARQPKGKGTPEKELGGGGSFGGGGTVGTWEEPQHPPSTPRSSARNAAPAKEPRKFARPAVLRTKPPAQIRTVVRGDYTYEIDSLDRTRRVSGELTLSEEPVRSRTTQTRAGGDDRRTSDDGGHYIAARFNGPTDAFNHFAQDANFNRGRYRLLEDEWARAKRFGSSVTVTIVPYYTGRSTRPSAIDVWFTIDGDPKSLKFPNEPSEKPSGKR